MTQAAGMYNTLLKGDDPALLIEVLNGYRVKEKLPSNISEFTVPLGVPEVLRAGENVTLVTYGATTRIVMEAADLLASGLRPLCRCDSVAATIGGHRNQCGRSSV